MSDDEILAKRDKDAFEAEFEAGRDYTELAKDYGRMLVERAVADRIDDEWLFAARDFLTKTAVARAEKAKVTK